MAKRTKKELKEVESLVTEMRKRYDQYVTAERHNIDAALLDLQVLVGEEHWDAATVKERKEDGRPCLVVNQLPVFTRQVIGDQRQSRPSTQVIPSDKAATPEVAELIEGKIREIKYMSKADAAHDNAFGQAVRSSFGYWRIRTDYESDDSFDQTIRIEAIPNQFGVKFDPLSSKWDKSDANWLIVETMISKDTFKGKYPDKEPSQGQLTDIGASWFSDDGVKIVEYYKKKPKPKTLYQMESGYVTEDVEELDYLKEMGDTIKNQREVDSYEICRYLMCGHDILEEEQIWPSKYWPVIELLGEVVNVNGKPYKRSLIRDAHDSQRSYNYAISSEVETFSLAPKAPYIATPKQISGHENQWKQAHKRTYPYLLANPDPQAPGWPGRLEPPQLSSAITAFRVETKQTFRDTIGIYNASLGERSNEISGIAIEGRKRESDTGTYLYIDNLQFALELEDRTILDLLPKIFDTNRTTMTRSTDGKSQAVEINKPTVVDGQQIIENDLTKGKYDVVVTLGPSFSTQRQEASSHMMELIKAAPQLTPFVVDKLVRSMDFHDAADLAKRLLIGVVPRQVLDQDELKDLPPEANQEQPDPMAMIQVELAASQVRLDMAKADKTLAEVEKIRAEIGLSQNELLFKVQQAMEARIGEMVNQQGGGQNQPQSSPPQARALVAVPGRAEGGPVEAGQPYIVGEKGQPELFVPASAGVIIPPPLPKDYQIPPEQDQQFKDHLNQLPQILNDPFWQKQFKDKLGIDPGTLTPEELYLYRNQLGI